MNSGTPEHEKPGFSLESLVPDDAFKPDESEDATPEVVDPKAAAAAEKARKKEEAAAKKEAAKAAKAEAKAAKQAAKQESVSASNGVAEGEPPDSEPQLRSADAFEVEDGGDTSPGAPAERGGGGARAFIFCTLDDPESSTLAAVIGGFIMLLIFLGSLAFVVETLPDVKAAWGPEMELLEVVCVISFTMDYLMRVFTCTARPKPNGLMVYLAEPLNIVDIASILPWYMEKLFSMGGSMSILRVLRMARIFRSVHTQNTTHMPRSDTHVLYSSIRSGFSALDRRRLLSLTALRVCIFFCACGCHHNFPI